MAIFIIVIAIILLWAVFSYNRFIRLINMAKEAWAGIDVQLKRRYDLIPNLVNAVKGYAAHEKAAFENVTSARAIAMRAQSLADKGQAEAKLSDSLKSIFVIAEAYPELKANQNFLVLQNELSGTEDKIQAARRLYNGNVRDLNTSIASFPGNLIAGIFHFQLMEMFALGANDAVTREPVNVSF